MAKFPSSLKLSNFTFLTELHVLVNSAGILVNGPTESLGWSDYDRCMDINAKAAFVLTQAAIPHLKKTKVRERG